MSTEGEAMEIETPAPVTEAAGSPVGDEEDISDLFKLDEESDGSSESILQGIWRYGVKAEPRFLSPSLLLCAIACVTCFNSAQVINLSCFKQ